MQDDPESDFHLLPSRHSCDELMSRSLHDGRDDDDDDDGEDSDYVIVDDFCTSQVMLNSGSKSHGKSLLFETLFGFAFFGCFVFHPVSPKIAHLQDKSGVCGEASCRQCLLEKLSSRGLSLESENGEGMQCRAGTR